MKKLILRKILAPLGERLGTALAAFLVGTVAVDPVMVDQFIVAIGAVLMIGTDLLIAHFERKRGR